MAPYHVCVTDFVKPPLTLEKQVLGDVATVEALDAMSEAELFGRIEQADAIMIYHFVTLGRKTIDQLKHCQLIVRCGVGFDNVDIRAARERGIPVANVPDYGTEDVADSAIGMLLTLMRGIHYTNSRLQKQGGPWSYELTVPLQRLRQCTLGIVGLGRIGTATALRAKALGLQVIFHDPFVPDGQDKALGITRCDTLDGLLTQADAVTIHCPRTEQTQHLFGRETIEKMKPGAFLVNTARGGVVDAQAVLAAIESEHLRGAALDVLEVEPPLDDEPLIQAWRDPEHPAHSRVIINPHSAFYSEQGLDDMRIKGSQNCLRVLRGEAPRNVVNG